MTPETSQNGKDIVQKMRADFDQKGSTCQMLIIALMEPTFENHICTMHALFQMEEKLDIRVVEKDGCYCLQFGDGRTGDMNSYKYGARKLHELARHR